MSSTRRNSRAAEETLSLELLEHEKERPRRSAANLHYTSCDVLAAELATKLSSYAEHTDANRESALQSSDVAEISAARALDILHTMQRFASLYAKKDTVDTQQGRLLDECLTGWTRWLRLLGQLPHSRRSVVVTRLPLVFATLCGSADVLQHHAVELTGAAKEALHLLRSASRSFESEVEGHCLPLHSLLPPWAVLEACARYSWTWEQLTAALRHLLPASPSASSSAPPAESTLRADSGDVAFRQVWERVEVAHAAQLTRAVLLNSFDSVDWKVGSAVPTVCSVAPTMWCLYSRCRSLALHGLLIPPDSSSSSRPTYHEDGCARRLVARVLRCAIDGVRSCLAQNVTDMHPARVEQLTRRDVPCLVLLTRLWYTYLRPCPALHDAVHASLVRVVNTAVELQSPLMVEEAAAVVDEAVEGAEEATEKEEATRATMFLEAVWNVKPLEEDEIVADSAAVPWAATFPRAAVMQLVLQASVVVTTVD